MIPAKPTSEDEPTCADCGARPVRMNLGTIMEARVPPRILTYAICGMRIPSMDKTTLYLTPDLRLRLRAAARRSGRRQADVIRSALDAYLDEAKANRPQSIGAGADDAVDAADTEAWLREHWRARDHA